MSDVGRALVVSIGLMIVVVGLASWWGSHKCSSLQEETGLPTKYRNLRCYVQVKGQWVPESAWRVEP